MCHKCRGNVMFCRVFDGLFLFPTFACSFPSSSPSSLLSYILPVPSFSSPSPPCLLSGHAPDSRWAQGYETFPTPKISQGTLNGNPEGEFETSLISFTPESSVPTSPQQNRLRGNLKTAELVDLLAQHYEQQQSVYMQCFDMGSSARL